MTLWWITGVHLGTTSPRDHRKATVVRMPEDSRHLLDTGGVHHVFGSQAVDAESCKCLAPVDAVNAHDRFELRGQHRLFSQS